jgi:hypothetical protein
VPLRIPLRMPLPSSVLWLILALKPVLRRFMIDVEYEYGLSL